METVQTVLGNKMDVGPTWLSPFFRQYSHRERKPPEAHVGPPAKELSRDLFLLPGGGFPEAKVRSVLVSCGLESGEYGTPPDPRPREVLPLLVSGDSLPTGTSSHLPRDNLNGFSR